MSREGAKHGHRGKPHRPGTAAALSRPVRLLGFENPSPPPADAFSAALATPEGRAMALSEMDSAISRLVADHGRDPERFMLEKRQSPLPSPIYRIVGDAMRDEGILDGDRVEVDKLRVAKAGDVVIVSSTAGRIEARRAAQAECGLVLKTRGPGGVEIDPATDAGWTILGVARRLTRDL